MSTAADHLREALDVGCTRDDHDHIADHADEVRAEHTDVFVRWLYKKAAEYRAAGGTAAKKRQRAVQAEAIELLADKARRGAVRPNNLLMPSGARPGLSDSERQFLTFALDLAADQMASRGDEFDSDDEAALESLRALSAAPATEDGDR